MIKVKRVYDRADITDGERVLVERSWPRGIRRSTTNIDFWLKEIGPSDDLRRWFGRNPDKWALFKIRYRRELESGKALDRLAEHLVDKDPVTLLYLSHDPSHNAAKVLVSILGTRIRAKAKELNNGS